CGSTTGRAERTTRLPALAFGSHCSVFKERRGTHPKALVPGPAISLPTGGSSSYRWPPEVSKASFGPHGSHWPHSVADDTGHSGNGSCGLHRRRPGGPAVSF